MQTTKQKNFVTSSILIVTLIAMGGYLMTRGAGSRSSFSDPTLDSVRSSEAENAAHTAIDLQYRKLLDAELQGNALDSAAIMSPSWIGVTSGETTTKKHWLRLRRIPSFNSAINGQVVKTVKSFAFRGNEALVTIQTDAYIMDHNKRVKDTHLDEDHWELIGGQWLWAKTAFLSEHISN